MLCTMFLEKELGGFPVIGTSAAANIHDGLRRRMCGQSWRLGLRQIGMLAGNVLLEASALCLW